MPDEDVIRIGQEYADLFNRSEPADIEQMISEACIETHWDDRTNLLSLLASSHEEMGLVLATVPGGEDYLVVRFCGHWVVDFTPVDWDTLEDEWLEPIPAERRAEVEGRQEGRFAGYDGS